MPSQVFLAPKLTGARFDDHEIPLEFLKDFAALEDFVVQVAKWHFLTANRTRERSPKGFLANVSLRLSAVQEGSTIAKIVLSIASIAGQLQFNQPYLEASRDSIVAAIGAAQHGTSAITDHLPEHLLSHFQHFGRSLRDGEAIQFGEDSNAVKLTKETRRKLLSVATNAVISDTVTIVGMIPEADHGKGTFQVELDGDRRFGSREFARHREAVSTAWNGYDDGIKVRVRGVWRVSASGELQSIEELTSVNVLDPLDVPLRIEELRQLADGWLDGDGVALPADGADWLSNAFEEYYSTSLALPHIYPTPDGGIRAEWSLPDWEASLEIDLASRTAEWHALNMKSGADQIESLDLVKSPGWEWFMGRLAELGGARNE